MLSLHPDERPEFFAPLKKSRLFESDSTPCSSSISSNSSLRQTALEEEEEEEEVEQEEQDDDGDSVVSINIGGK